MLLFILPFLLISCSNKLETRNMKFDTSYTITQDLTVPFNGKRIYLLHGFLGNRHFWDNGIYKTLKQDLINSGYQIITFDLPYTKDYFFFDGGKLYRKLYEQQVRAIKQNVEQELGLASKNIIGGFSFGGLHSLMGQALMSDLFESYFAVLPVVRLSAIKEMQGISTEHFNPVSEIQTFNTKSGLLIWANNDTRVGNEYTEALFNKLINMGAPVSYYESIGTGHAMTMNILNETKNWLSLQ